MTIKYSALAMISLLILQLTHSTFVPSAPVSPLLSLLVLPGVTESPETIVKNMMEHQIHVLHIGWTDDPEWKKKFNEFYDLSQCYGIDFYVLFATLVTKSDDTPEAISRLGHGGTIKTASGETFLHGCPAYHPKQQNVLSELKIFLERYPETHALILDFIRYPMDDDPVAFLNLDIYCYCNYCRSEFKKEFGVDPAALTLDQTSLWKLWIDWRIERVLSFVRKARDIIKEEGPDIKLGVTLVPTPHNISRIYLAQDWMKMTEYVDVFEPMMYEVNILDVANQYGISDKGLLKYWANVMMPEYKKLDKEIWVHVGGPVVKPTTPDLLSYNLELYRKKADGIVVCCYQTLKSDHWAIIRNFQVSEPEEEEHWAYPDWLERTRNVWLLGVPLVMVLLYNLRRKQGKLSILQIKLGVTVACLILCFYAIYRPLPAIDVSIPISLTSPIPYTINFPIGRIIYAILYPFAPYLEIILILVITGKVLSLCGKILEKQSQD